MRPAPLAALGLVVLGLVLTGCTAPAPQEPAAAATPTPTPSPTPTIEPRVIGPAEMPPVPFDGDCASMITAEDIVDVVGESWTFEGGYSEGVVANVGGLQCSFRTAGGRYVNIAVLPKSGLNGTQLSQEIADFYFAECSPWSCAWQGGDDDLWIALNVNERDLTRETVDGWGSGLAQRILARRAESAPAPWVRDRTGWWPVFDCAQIAEAVGSRLGQTLVGSDGGWEDPPGPAYTLAYDASRSTDCILELGETSIHLGTASGTDNDLMQDVGWQPADLGVPGITAFVGDQESVVGYALTDGINDVSLLIYGEQPPFPTRNIAVAVAAAAATGFQ